MNRLLNYLGIAGVLAACVIGASLAGHAEDEHHHDHGHHDEEEEGEHLSPKEMESFGVRWQTAGPGVVDLGLELPGEVRPNPERLAHVAARFPGIVREVHKRVGDRVAAGETLARIQGDNLSTFEIAAPFAATILDCHIVAGESVSPQNPAFVIADLSIVWVLINVYQQDLARVRVGQSVRIQSNTEDRAEAPISYISPAVDQATRTALARVVLPNSDGRWRPGLFVTAAVLEPVEVAISVPETALQRWQGDEVVFIASGDRFQPRTVRVGRRGTTTVEIVNGLERGDRYAASGSFLIKAELGKGEAEHDH